MKKSLLAATIAGLSFLGNAAFGAAITTVNVSIAKQLFNQDNAALSGGALGAGNNGDGAILQIGYYDLATTSNLFAGQWVPITGEGSFNPNYDTTVGDGINSGAANRAVFALTFDTSAQRLPQAGTPFGIRIYNQTSTGVAAWFAQTVISPDWLWLNPAEPPSNPSISIAFTNLNARLQSNNALLSTVSTVQTVTPVPPPVIPEPTSIALLMAGLVSFASSRRRAGKV